LGSREADQASRPTLTNRHVEDATATIEQLTRIHAESAVARRNQVVRLRSVPAAEDGPEKTTTGT